MLKTKKIGKYTVSQAGLIHSVRRMNMMKEIQAKIEGGGLPDEVTAAIAVYPHIAGCIEPRFTIEQMLQMPEQEIDKLTQAVMDLNPHWFELPPEEKKSDPELTNSTTDSDE